MEDRLAPENVEGVEGLSLKERLLQAQDLVARHVHPGAMLSEELISERRVAAGA